MFRVVRTAQSHSLKWLLAFSLAAAASQGCGSGKGTEEQVLDQFFKESKMKRETVAKFAGHVTIDGQPPSRDVRLFVILNNAENFQKSGKTAPLHAPCDAQGNFAFTTYVTGDGVPTGKYVVTFAALHHSVGSAGGAGGRRGRTPGLMQQFVGPDELKNLYNDPEKNKNEAAFQVEVADPGRTDYEFSLSIAGKDPVPSPGQYAVTSIRG
jgi:hypothetical protein